MRRISTSPVSPSQREQETLTREQNTILHGAHLEQHVLLVGSEVHLVLVVVHAQVDDVGQQLLVPVDHLQLLLQRLGRKGRKGRDG